MPANAKAAMWDVPVGPGETFRWVFVTSGRTQATSTAISTYNVFVNNAAYAAGSVISDVFGKSTIADIEWWAIGSTPTINAIVNIGGASSVGIYLPTGKLVANGTDDMFDGTINNIIGVTEVGGLGGGPVWTGSTWAGVKRFTYALGSGSKYAAIGVTSSTDGAWMGQGVEPQPTWKDYRLYAISEELTVVPVPSALILGATGLLSSTLGLIRLRRKHQEASQI